MATSEEVKQKLDHLKESLGDKRRNEMTPEELNLTNRHKLLTERYASDTSQEGLDKLYGELTKNA